MHWWAAPLGGAGGEGELTSPVVRRTEKAVAGTKLINF